MPPQGRGSRRLADTHRTIFSRGAGPATKRGGRRSHKHLRILQIFRDGPRIACSRKPATANPSRHSREPGHATHPRLARRTLRAGDARSRRAYGRTRATDAAGCRAGRRSAEHQDWRWRIGAVTIRGSLSACEPAERRRDPLDLPGMRWACLGSEAGRAQTRSREADDLRGGPDRSAVIGVQRRSENSRASAKTVTATGGNRAIAAAVACVIGSAVPWDTPGP